jgi:microcystin-dependent protein
MFPYGGDSPPAGFLFGGQNVSRTTYAALFAVFGTKFGVGDGSTTFGLPQWAGRAPIGHDAGDNDFNVVGKTGGAKTSALPNHLHSMPHEHTVDSHTHGMPHTQTLASGSNVSGGVDGIVAILDGELKVIRGTPDVSPPRALPITGQPSVATTDPTSPETSEPTNANTGNPTTNPTTSVVQPYLTINWIIKY